MTGKRFDGRVVAVPGGGGNIGGAICRRFAAEGAKVAIIDVHEANAHATAEEVLAAGGRAMAVAADLRTSDAVEESFARVVDEFGRIEILVNSAGVDHSLDPVDIDDDEWDLIIDTNLRLPFLTCRAVVADWQASGAEGAIVNIASVESVMPFPQQVHYASSKGGVQMLTRALARDVARFGIRVNAVGPGTVPRREEASDKYDDYLGQYPLGRLGTGADIAAAVAFLASDDASWITGQTLYVDGGWLVR